MPARVRTARTEMIPFMAQHLQRTISKGDANAWSAVGTSPARRRGRTMPSLRADASVSRDEMAGEPSGGQPGDLVERARLFEQMARPRHHDQLARRAQPPLRPSVQLEHPAV